jgi:hypothetical protein
MPFPFDRPLARSADHPPRLSQWTQTGNDHRRSGMAWVNMGFYGRQRVLTWIGPVARAFFNMDQSLKALSSGRLGCGDGLAGQVADGRFERQVAVS